MRLIVRPTYNLHVHIIYCEHIGQVAVFIYLFIYSFIYLFACFGSFRITGLFRLVMIII